MENNKCWRGCGEIGKPQTCWCECTMVQLLWKTVWQVLKKPKTEITIWPSNSIPSYIPPKIENPDWGTCMPKFRAALFTTVKGGNNPRAPLTDEWINWVWSIHTMEHCSAIKRNEVPEHTSTWMNLESLLCEIGQTQKDQYFMIRLTWSI